jgi:hypothetical protein
MQLRSLVSGTLAVGAVLSLASFFGSAAHETAAQTPASLDDQLLLSLVLPPLADGSRPGVHMWARADQLNGPGGLPTVFVVTLYTRQAAGGPEELEIVNYVQYSGSSWAAARPRDPGTLLISDWAWLSLNLTNLTANVSGTGNSSAYTVDYTSSGTYSGNPRQLSLEELYAADLSLTSSTVLSDSSNLLPSGAVLPASATPTATSRPSGAAAASPTGTSSAVTPTTADATPTRAAISASPAGAGGGGLGTASP